MPADDIHFDQPQQLNVQKLADAVGGTTSPLASLAGIIEQEAPHTASEWKKRRKLGFTVTLPSGMKVHVRRTFDLLSRLKKKPGEEGSIPNPLAGLVQDMIESKRPGMDINAMGEKAVEQMLRMFDQTLEAMMIVPRFQARPEGAPWDWEPDEDAIGPSDMGLEDKVFLFQLAQGGTADLATFRQQSADIVASIPDSPEVPGEAK